LTREEETPVQPDEIIRELIATGTMNEETLADLERMRSEFAAGMLDPDDAAYLQALHARVTNAPMPEIENVPPPAERRIEGLTAEEWRDRALKAEAELAEIRDLQATTGSS
jgi:hypothetical protein